MNKLAKFSLLSAITLSLILYQIRRYFKKLWERKMKEHESIPLPKIEDYLSEKRRGLWGTWGIDFSEKIEGLKKLPKGTSMWKERYLLFNYHIVTSDPRHLHMAKMDKPPGYLPRLLSYKQMCVG